MSNFYNNSQSEYSGSDEYLEIFGFVGNLIKSEPEISPNEVYDKLVDEGLIDPDSDEFPIHFGEANLIDRTFFGTGGGFWLDAFSRPHEGIKFVEGANTYVALNCGIFTCNIEKYYEHDEHDEHDKNLEDNESSSWETTSSSSVNEGFVSKVDNIDSQDNLENQSEQDEEDIELILAESKEFANELKKFIESRLIGEPDIKPWDMFEIIKSHFPEFDISRRLCFGDAYDIDKHIYNKGGSFWRNAYNLPKEFDHVEYENNKFDAKNVGIFTFDY